MCEMSAMPMLFGPNAKASPEKCINVEDQKEVWAEAQNIGRIIGEKLK